MTRNRDSAPGRRGRGGTDSGHPEPGATHPSGRYRPWVTRATASPNLMRIQR